MKKLKLLTYECPDCGFTVSDYSEKGLENKAEHNCEEYL